MGFVKSGDNVHTIGTPDISENETETARRLNKMSYEDRWDALREDRKLQNTPGRWIFGLDPEAAQHMKSKTVPVEAGTEILLMTDGLYRLIDPYKSHTPADLFASPDGMLGLLAALRTIEDGGELAETRVKMRDDACGLWLCVEGDYV